VGSREEAGTVLIAGDGPAGVETAIRVKKSRPELCLVCVGLGQATPFRWPRKAAWPAGMGYLQPDQAEESERTTGWFASTLPWAQALAGKTPGAAHMVEVTSLHNNGWGHRPGWAEAVATEELRNRYTPEGWANGFRWRTYVVDPIEAHRDRVDEATRLGVEFHRENLASLEHVAGLCDAYGAGVVVDALGLGSNMVFGDERITGVISHQLRWPNMDPKDMRAVMADTERLYVVSGPNWIYAGATSPADVDPRYIDKLDLTLSSSNEDRLFSALYRLRPDLAYNLVNNPPEHVVGIRPHRPEGIRLEPEFGLPGLPPVVHITGLGNCGWSIFVGAARTAATYVLDLIGNQVPTR